MTRHVTAAALGVPARRHRLSLRLGEADARPCGPKANGGTPRSPETAAASSREEGAFLPSTPALDPAHREALETTPTLRAPDGEAVGPIVTDASDHAVAGRMGVLRAPKLCHLGADHPGARAATVEDGEMVSRGTTDLSPS